MWLKHAARNTEQLLPTARPLTTKLARTREGGGLGRSNSKYGAESKIQGGRPGKLLGRSNSKTEQKVKYKGETSKAAMYNVSA